MGRIKQSENCSHLGKFAKKTKPSNLVLKYKKVKETRHRTETNLGRANKNPGFKNSILKLKKKQSLYFLSVDIWSAQRCHFLF